ncbi:MAG: HlyD family efflux transporter periplasmic adaptor subunit [Bacteroidota bacterium]
MNKRRLLVLGILAGCVALAIVLIANRPDPPTTPLPSTTPLVQTAPAELRSGTLVVAGAGTVRAHEEAALATQVSGRVRFVAPELVSGGRIRSGQVLLRIDPADFENRVEQALADVASQDVTVLQAEEEARLALEEYERFAARAASREQDSGAEGAARVRPPATLSAAPGGEGSATENTATGIAEPSPLTLREPQRQAALAARQRAAAALSDAELALSRTIVRAPFDGVVRAENVAPGDVVQAGQPFAQLIALDAVEAVIPLSNDEAALVPDLFSGRAVPAQVIANYGDLYYRWNAAVDRVDATLDETARTINVVLRIPRPFTSGALVQPDPASADVPVRSVVPTTAPPLLVGTYVEAKIDGARLERYLAVPRVALRRDDTVWTVERDSVLRVVPVAVLQDLGATVLVEGALDDGTPLVTNNLTGVVDGMSVRLATPLPSVAVPAAPVSSTASRLDS